MRKYYTESSRTGISYIQRRERWLIGLVTMCRNCLLKHVVEGNIEGGIEVTGIQGRRRQQLLDDFKEATGYLKWKDEAPDRTLENSLWKTL
jgi:hypothetical protein